MKRQGGSKYKSLVCVKIRFIYYNFKSFPTRNLFFFFTYLATFLLDSLLPALDEKQNRRNVRMSKRTENIQTLDIPPKHLVSLKDKAC